MMEDLYAKFLPQFIVVARARVAAAIKAVDVSENAAFGTVVNELHALAGEAGLLGLIQIVKPTRQCELKAKELRAGAAEQPGTASLLSELRELAAAVESLANKST